MKLHWISPSYPFRFSDGKVYDKVYFEVKLPVLKTRPASPSHMDVVLISDDCGSMLCFESKLSEYTKRGGAEFADAYKKGENYYNNHFKLLSHFRATSGLSDDIWQYFVLPNYAYTYNDILAIMRNQMPDGLADYLECRYPTLKGLNMESYPVHRL